ncbi:hypothetical protein KJ865_10980, partial [Myxococcota bacterium]|nr:hypothetical protein [Myxococcota bacterium]
HIRLKDMDPLVGEIHPIDEGIHEGSAFMVWPWPACTAIAKRGLKPGKAVSVAKSLFDAALERLENGGTEPQPWEVVMVNTEWGLLAGWERVDIAHEMAGASLAAPERFRGGAPTDSTKVYLHASLIYLLASGRAPMGLLRPPSGNGVNVEPFDLAVAGGLCVRPDQRTRRENFIPELERSLGILSPGKKILQMAGAAMGIGLLLAIGYGLSALMASL